MKNTTINEKGLDGYLKDDKSLLEERTFEEMTSTKTGFDDSGIDEAYEEFCAVQKRTGVKPKGLEGYLNDDKSLLEKRTFDEINTTKNDFDNNRILKTKTTEFLDSKVSDFFPETGYWNSHCFGKSCR